MTIVHYEVCDVDSGDVLGVFDSQDEANRARMVFARKNPSECLGLQVLAINETGHVESPSSLRRI